MTTERKNRLAIIYRAGSKQIYDDEKRIKSFALFHEISIMEAEKVLYLCNYYWDIAERRMVNYNKEVVHHAFLTRKAIKDGWLHG